MESLPFKRDGSWVWWKTSEGKGFHSLVFEGKKQITMDHPHVAHFHTVIMWCCSLPSTAWPRKCQNISSQLLRAEAEVVSTEESEPTAWDREVDWVYN